MKSVVKAVIEGKSRDLGGFTVRRILPQIGHHSVGPFVFFDHLGPVVLPPGSGLDVRPHPHIGLATVTYLFEGELEHRDSLGTVQVIQPGDINWMSAGKGIVHSERSGAARRAAGGPMHGLQLWVALPVEAEESEPAFYHHQADQLPSFLVDGVKVRLIAGAAYGRRSPVETASRLFYTEAHLSESARLASPEGYDQTAIYVIGGSVTVDDRAVSAGQMALLQERQTAEIEGTTDAHVVILGGDSLEGPRHLFWNFVSSSKERIETAKNDWAAGRFATVPGDDERIPLPASP